jgi:hypothetical protein
MLLDILPNNGVAAGRKHVVVTLMRRMGIEALYRRPRPSVTNSLDRIHGVAAGHRIKTNSQHYYILRQLDVNPAKLHFKNKLSCHASRRPRCEPDRAPLK